MITDFDNFSDEDISRCVLGSCDYSLIQEYDHLSRITKLANDMRYWKCWLGPPVTIYPNLGNRYDGNHRVRACKYLESVFGMQIQIPLRFDSVPKCK